jgi:FkbM family methyltransferase
MKVKRLFSVLSLKDFFIIYIGNTLYRILFKINYYQFYLPLYTLIEKYTKEDFYLKAQKDSLLIYGKGSFEKYQFLIRPVTSDHLVFDQIVIHKEYESVLELAKKVKEGVNTIIDAGSNVGFTALYFNSLFSNAKIICIEADEKNFSHMQKNISINNLQNKIIPIHAALWNNDGQELVVTSEFRDGNSWSKSVKLFENNKGVSNKFKAISLHSIIMEFQIEKIDILKIDIEGAEKELFDDHSFIDNLSKYVKIICLEIHDERSNRKEILSKLYASQFELFDTQETTFGYNKKLV